MNGEIEAFEKSELERMLNLDSRRVTAMEGRDFEIHHGGDLWEREVTRPAIADRREHKIRMYEFLQDRKAAAKECYEFWIAEFKKCGPPVI